MTLIDTTIIIIYFLTILLFGSFFGRYAKTTKDFFTSGQRFSWWFIAMSNIATTVGSYSFIKYSEKAYEYGFSSTQAYLNDWFLLPLWIFGWFPIIYYSKVRSVPEYFEKRFGKSARIVVTILLLVYMIGYIGINLYTIGVAFNAMFGWNIYWITFICAIVVAIYVSFGGQPSVIMTDLLQGFMLLLAGLFLFFAGIEYVGGFKNFLGSLSVEHIRSFTPFNSPPDFSAVGIFWQDGIANTATFYFINQGIILRFLSVKSEKDGRKAMFVTVLFLLPIAAIAVSNAGWIAIAMEKLNLIEGKIDPKKVFIIVTKILCSPGVMGFVLAALLAALMSTTDTLVNAVSSIAVNDIWQPYISPNREDSYYLKIGRYVSFASTIFGFLLVPLYASFQSIYDAHGTFTAAITPPLVVAVVLGFLWKRYTNCAVLFTIIGGSFAITISMVFPQIIYPFSHGIAEGGSGAKAYMYIRALFGISSCLFIGIIVSLFTKPKQYEEISGLVMGARKFLLEKYKGGEIIEGKTRKILLKLFIDKEGDEVLLSKKDTEKMGAMQGDLIYICDKRWWLGGLHSVHTKISKLSEKEGFIIVPEKIAREGKFLKEGIEIKVEKIL